VPVTNGAIPVAPEGAHSSQDGTLFEPVAVPVAADPPDPCRADEPAVADALDPAPVPEPPAGAGAVVELLCPATAVDSVVARGRVTAPYGLARLVPATPPLVAVV